MTTAELEVVLRQTVRSVGFTFRPGIEYVCPELGIAVPEVSLCFTYDGADYAVYAFTCPDDAAAFRKHFSKTQFAPAPELLSGTVQ